MAPSVSIFEFNNAFGVVGQDFAKVVDAEDFNPDAPAVRIEMSRGSVDLLALAPGQGAFDDHAGHVEARDGRVLLRLECKMLGQRERHIGPQGCWARYHAIDRVTQEDGLQVGVGEVGLDLNEAIARFDHLLARHRRHKGGFLAISWSLSSGLPMALRPG